ncbi:unnamed protein product [Orchesella dallaii]|uniref:Chitin-binding type-4 domain-containing protein n=1 Tax=Orchesella dallaii TaxID=48710 RepID=A0ABP1QS99_9HEXA
MGNRSHFVVCCCVEVFLACILSSLLLHIAGHGRLMEPPNRSSLWRFPEFDQHAPPINYNDNELFCGGFPAQHEFNGGRCGVCGDNYNDTRPRANEHKGQYGNGIISRNYTQGQNITSVVELTFGHLGHFEFRLCKLQDSAQTEAEDCFDQYLLSLADGSGTKFPVPDLGAHWYRVDLTLPEELECEHCVLQWHYVAGNSWGNCGNGTEAIGCGPQETFRGCSDIAISLAGNATDSH